MKKRVAIVSIFLTVIIATVIIAGFVVWQTSTPSSDQASVSVTKTVTTPTPTATKGASIPSLQMNNAHLLIPSIGLDAPIEPVGLDKTGRMSIPSQDQWFHVGWYKNGTVPGKPGSAVLDGHLDRPGGLPAVFWKLHEVKVGDVVTISDKDGKQLHFKVMRTQMYPIAEAPVKQIFSDASGSYLNLITCAGSWIPSQQQTTHRLVVYTKLVP